MHEDIDWSEVLTVQLTEDGETFPFTEDENCNITGYGHQDKAEFAAAINRYDTEATGETCTADEQWTADDIGHAWVVYDPTTERFHTALGRASENRPVTEATPGAFPVTELWGAR